MIDLLAPIENLKSVGPRNLSKLKQLGLKTIGDLLWHFPSRYQDFSLCLPIERVSVAGETVNIRGTITDIKSNTFWRRRKMTITNATVDDESGSIRAVWFNQPYLDQTLASGTFVSLAGKVNSDKKGLFLSSPSYEKFYGDSELKHTAGLVPIYPETEGVTSKYLRFLIKPIISQIKNIPDSLPREIIKKYKLPGLLTALRSIHFPNSLEETELAKQRFSLEEILLFQLRVLRDHRYLQTLRAPKISFNAELVSEFVKTLPFKLTNDQRVAAFEILKDLERSFPMNRLLNGDVGSGKTIVALIAAYQAAHAGFQSAFMAPTEILARQHYQTIKNLLPEDSKHIRIGLITGSEARQWPRLSTEVGVEDPRFSERKSGPIDEIAEEKVTKKLMAHKLAEGEIDIIIGTHALVSAQGATPAVGQGPASGGQSIKFKNLGLVIIDEQHRFGVNQRKELTKGSSFVPHLLSMTATPIPRTLALTIFGDLDISLLKEKPSGRQTIITKIIADEKRKQTHEFIDKEIANGRQVFVICPRIEIAETSPDFASQNRGSSIFQPNSLNLGKIGTKLVWAEVKAVTEEYERLSKTIFPHRRVSMLHGKMRPAEKNKIMDDFKNGRCDILVSTSVIEVGVDVPNAVIMMIESAERFGLAQLHQFRGRVGRGRHQSYCFLMTGTSTAGRRLRALEKTDNGFELAEADLKIRGPGEFSGVKQSGLPDFAMASLADVDLIKKARLEARLLLKNDPTLKKYPLLLARLNEMQRLKHFE